MVEGSSRDRWEHTSGIQATIINANPYRKNAGRVVHPAQLNPYRVADAKTNSNVIRTTLRELFHTYGQSIFGNAGRAPVKRASDPQIQQFLEKNGLTHLLDKQKK
jgi:hypothetical protein